MDGREKESRRMRNIDLVKDDRWKKKGGPIKRKYPNLDVCTLCYGTNQDCPNCQGLGEVEK